MRNTPFKGLAEALSGSSDWAAVDRSWREAESLMSHLREYLPGSLASLVTQVRREDPPRGIRGSQVTVVAEHAAAAAKLRLALADWPEALRTKGWGIQHLRVTMRRDQEIAAPPAAPSRRSISPQVRQELHSLAQSHPREALARALKRMASRGEKG